ncbi:MAG TPA: hypothetical protein PKV56_14015, partial [Burkholderiaceae bacterium]|nr:hypothetical protein [Burkholderiaceae bacterium]
MTVLDLAQDTTKIQNGKQSICSKITSTGTIAISLVRPFGFAAGTQALSFDKKKQSPVFPKGGSRGSKYLPVTPSKLAGFAVELAAYGVTHTDATGSVRRRLSRTAPRSR